MDNIVRSYQVFAELPRDRVLRFLGLALQIHRPTRSCRNGVRPVLALGLLIPNTQRGARFRWNPLLFLFFRGFLAGLLGTLGRFFFLLLGGRLDPLGGHGGWRPAEERGCAKNKRGANEKLGYPAAACARFAR